MMHSFLPNLAPRDPHTIWYTSRRRPPGSPPRASTSNANATATARGDAGPQGNSGGDHSLNPSQHAHRTRSHALYLRHSEHRLVDKLEQANAAERIAAAGFGSTWLKPPGVSKTLHQITEERREQEEHAEALRREQLAQELAEAEEAAAAGAAGDGMMVDGDEDGAAEGPVDGGRDLDDDVPEGDEAMGWDDTDEEEGAVDENEDGSSTSEEYANAQQVRAEQTLRQAMVRGNADLAEAFDGSEGDLDEDGRGALLDEDDFASGGHEVDLDMDANLDDDIPDADASGLGGYEHTDSDAALTSSEAAEDDDDDDDDHEVYTNVSRLAPPQSPTLRTVRERNREEPRASMDLSSILSRDESSFMESSPAMRGAQAPRP